MKISIIVPCYNECKTIERLVDKLILLNIRDKQIIVVDDGSNDGSRKILEEKIESKIDTVIYHKVNKGKGAAIISSKKALKGEIVVIQDADLEYDPEDLIKMYKIIKEGKTNIVYGSRVLGKNRYLQKSNFINIYRVFFNHVLTIWSNIINTQKLTDAHTCYKMFTRKVFDKIELKEQGFAFCPEITTKASKLKESIIEVPINYNGRQFQEGKKISTLDGVRAFYAVIKYKMID